MGKTGWCSRSRRHQHSGLSLYNCTTLELAIMLNLHLLVLMMGLTLEEEPLFQLNAGGYIECYEDLDCPNPIEIEEDNTIIRFSCSGEISFEPTVQDIRLYNSSGTYTVCEERISSSCCQENNTMIEGCEAQREEGCTEIFGGITALQALPGLAGISTWVNTRCPGCPFSCPRAMPCRVPIKGQKWVRCCKPIGLGRSSNVLACPFRCIT